MLWMRTMQPPPFPLAVPLLFFAPVIASLTAHRSSRFGKPEYPDFYRELTLVSAAQQLPRDTVFHSEEIFKTIPLGETFFLH
jgi:hypothetical protein